MKASAASILGLFALVMFAPTVQSAYAKDIHLVAGNIRCLDCHAWLPLNDSRPSFRDEIGSACVGCHRNYHGKAKGRSHPVDISPSMGVPRDMPLDSKGRIYCITCHTFHRGYKDADGKKLFFLRRSRGKAFCHSCHKKPLY